MDGNRRERFTRDAARATMHILALVGRLREDFDTWRGRDLADDDTGTCS